MAAEHPARSNGRRIHPVGGPFPRFDRHKHGVGGDWADTCGPAIVSRLQLRLRPGAEAAGESRHALDRLMGVLDEEQLETLRLLVTELITNAVRHTGSQQWIELDVDVYPRRIRAEVVDRGPGFHPPSTPEPHPDRPGGWGLCLVDNLADRWGVAIDDSTCVWFELDRDRQPRFAAA